jgi:tetratricopeptide (TPR) repeat protein
MKISAKNIIRALVIISSFIVILNYLNIHPIDFDRVSPSNMVSDLLDYSDKTFKAAYLNDYGNKFMENLVSIENNCSRDNPDQSLERLRCLMVIGQVYYGASLYSDAYRCFLKAKEVDPRVADPYFSIGNLYYDLSLLHLIKERQFDFDKDTLKFTLFPDDDAKALFQLAQEEYSEGEKLKGLNEIDPSLMSMGNTTLILIDWPLISHRKNQIDDVFSGSSSIRAQYSELISLPLEASIIYSTNKEFVGDMYQFQKRARLELRRNNMIAEGFEMQAANESVSKGNMLASQGRYDEAIQNYDNASSSLPYYAGAWLNKGSALAAQGNYGEALQAYDRAIEIDPRYAKAWYGKGRVLSLQENYDGAIRAFDKAIEIDPRYADAWNHKGIAFTFKKDFDEAIRAFDKAIEIDPRYADAWNYKAVALTFKENYDEALNAYSKAIEINPQLATAWCGKGGVIILLQGNYEEAILAYNKAIEMDPRYADAWHNKGNALMLLGRTEDANEAFDKAKELGYIE